MTFVRWAERPLAVRRTVTGAALLLAVLAALALLGPLQAARQSLVERVQRERQTTAAMEAMRIAVLNPDASRATANGASLRGEALRATVDASAHSALAPATVSVSLDGEAGVRLTVGGAALERLLLWIDAARRVQRLRLDTASFKPLPDGSVTAELRLIGEAP